LRGEPFFGVVDDSLFPVLVAFADLTAGEGVGGVVEGEDLSAPEAEVSALAGSVARYVWYEERTGPGSDKGGLCGG